MCYPVLICSLLCSIVEISYEICWMLDKLERLLEPADCLFTCRLRLLGQTVPGFQDFWLKAGKKREKEAVVWSGSRRISCLQGGPGYKATKGNALE